MSDISEVMAIEVFQLTLFFDMMSFIIVAGLVFLSSHLRSAKLEARLFKYMCFCLMAGSAAGVISYTLAVIDSIPSYWTFILAAYLFSDISGLIGIYFWVLFNDYMLYGSEDHLKRVRRIYLIPVAAAALLQTAVFICIEYAAPSVREIVLDLMIWIFYTEGLLNVVYLVVPAFIIWRYRRRTGRLVMFKTSPVVIPVLIAIVLTDQTEYSIVAMGFAIGLVSLFFSMTDVWKYESSTPGYFNREYLERMRYQAMNSNRDYSLAILISAGEKVQWLPEIIKSEMPKGREMIDCGSGRYAVFLHRTGRKVSELLVRRLKEDIDEYNGEHPGDAVEARIISVTRGREESPADFVCRMADEIWK